MDIKFSKDSADSTQASADNKGKQNLLLIVLLVLVGAFAYIYLFTGLIKPMSEQKLAEAPSAASQVTKKPLPVPDGEPAKADGAAGELGKDAAVPVPPAAVPAPLAPAKPAVQETAKAKEAPKTAEEAQSSVKNPLPVAGKAGTKKTAPVEKLKAADKKQPVVAGSKPLPAKQAEKKPAEVKKPVEKQAPAVAAVAKVKKDIQKPAKKEVGVIGTVAGSGDWVVLVGNYVLEEAMATDLARVRKAGLEAFIVPGHLKKTNMNRLLLAEYTDRDSAQAELAKLKRLAADAFVIEKAGMHYVYAGSYLLDTRAASEKERLSAAGFKLTLKRVDVSIPTKNLTAGSFAEKSAADNVLKKLRAAGVKATLSRP